MGASTRWPWPEEATDAATVREVVGSMVEQSMKRRLVRGEGAARSEA
ncbi:hypothetical protein IMZ48_42370 [Candidatus Bathyarchaeota archaeon]|nr:hypothetical protein [Candidatus Bathyarchaeota archaeon]